MQAGFLEFWSQTRAERSGSFLTRWLFLRLLGLIYLVAFVSLWTQIDGLIGSQGILPAADYLKAVARQIGPERFWWLPTFSWIDAGDGFLHCQCAAGVLFAVLLMAGVAPILDLVMLWALYLSLSTVGRDFLSFQWDILLLETGFLAIFLAPRQWLPGLGRESPPPLTMIWLARWLVFRLMFMSGAVKLLSGDSAWWDLTALTVHYETQPLPTWMGWHAHQLPEWFQRTSVLVMFFIELILPAFVFSSRQFRRVAFSGFASLMLLISATGNYTFFNLLTIALCVLLLDDPLLLRVLPRSVAARLEARLESARSRVSTDASGPVAGPSSVLHRVRFAGLIALSGLIFLLSATQTIARLDGDRSPSNPLLFALLRYASPLRTVNSYGLFAVMTVTRPEIVVEGSNDGVRWLPYEFKWKPGDLKRRPAFVAPHQPRLDWQMWFAALGRFRANPWFANTLVRLLQGSPEVLRLLETNPFPDAPPRYIRAVLYQYRFTDSATRKKSGDWWRRERLGMYCPALSLQSLRRESAGPPEIP
jgi:hypothetical protein